MSKAQARSLKKMEQIKRTALELFAKYGLDRVSMDEIAAQANVSKVSIYKYFNSKEELYLEVINLFIDETLADVESILDSDIDFLEKLKVILEFQTNSSQWLKFDELFKIWEKNNATAKGLGETIQAKTQNLIYKFYEEGKAKGYIHEDISFELLYLYAEIFRAGFRAISAHINLADKATLDELYKLYFFGFIKR